MSENNDEVPVIIQTSESAVINSTDKERFEEMFKQITENQQKLLEELRLSRNEQNGKKRGLKDVDDSTENPAKRVDSAIMSENAASLSASEMQSPIFEKTGKWFVMKHTFKNVSELEENGRVHGEKQEHFGITWKMSIRRDKEHLAFYTWCANKEAEGIWSIEADREVKLLAKDGKHEVKKSCDWEDLDQKYLIDDSLTFEVNFKIKSTTGIYKNNLRSFDDPECSDVVLVVQDKKFHVSKLTLAAHSSYFKAMFLGMFSDSKKSEIPLSGIDAADFQKYLEVLYAEPAVDEYSVEGILMIADMYDTQIAIRKCEEFLLEKSKKTLKKKLELSVRYGLENLKKQCLSKINTSNDIRAVLPPNICDLDHSLMADLFQKSLDNS